MESFRNDPGLVQCLVSQLEHNGCKKFWIEKAFGGSLQRERAVTIQNYKQFHPDPWEMILQYERLL